MKKSIFVNIIIIDIYLKNNFNVDVNIKFNVIMKTTAIIQGIDTTLLL